MTKELEAGPELDAKVAKEVMGWTLDKTNFHTFTPSTSISDAFEVVQEMRKKRYWLKALEQIASGVWITRFKNSAQVISSVGSTPAHSIVLAALKALEGK